MPIETIVPDEGIRDDTALSPNKSDSSVHELAKELWPDVSEEEYKVKPIYIVNRILNDAEQVRNKSRLYEGAEYPQQYEKDIEGNEDFIDSFVSLRNRIEIYKDSNLLKLDEFDEILKDSKKLIMESSWDYKDKYYFSNGWYREKDSRYTLLTNEFVYTLETLENKCEKASAEDKNRALDTLQDFLSDLKFNEDGESAPIISQTIATICEIGGDDYINRVTGSIRGIHSNTIEDKNSYEKEIVEKYGLEQEVILELENLYSKVGVDINSYLRDSDWGGFDFHLKKGGGSDPVDFLRNPELDSLGLKEGLVVPKLIKYIDPKTGDFVISLKKDVPSDVKTIDLIDVDEMGRRSKKRMSYQNKIEDDFYYTDINLEFGKGLFYQTHAEILRALSEISWDGKEDEGAKLLSNLMSVDSAGCLNRYVGFFSALGPKSYKYLLNNLKSEDKLMRRMSAEILFRLELGRIGVEKEGVEYLGKIYDLGKYNDPDFFVRRLNSSGVMGVLSENDGIKGVFNLDLNSEAETIKTKVRQLVSEELFLPRADETPEQKELREEYLKVFLGNYEYILNDKFFDGTGVKLNSLDLYEQGQFLLNYLSLSKDEKTEELTRLKSFVSKYGECGLKSFLALEYGGSGGEILRFSENQELSDDKKLSIFKSYYAIAVEAQAWRDMFGDIDGSVSYDFGLQVHEAFIRKNSEFFKSAMIIAEGKGDDITIDELIESMDDIAFSLRSLKEVYNNESRLELVQNPQYQNEYSKDGKLAESASSTFILANSDMSSRIVISIRPTPTVKIGNNSGGEARINFRVTNLSNSNTTRIGFDLSDYGKYIGDESRSPVVSLDLGVGRPARETGVWPSRRVGRVLGLVEGSEGGHNELSFSPKAAESFSDIARGFRTYIEDKFVNL